MTINDLKEKKDILKNKSKLFFFLTVGILWIYSLIEQRMGSMYNIIFS